VIRYDALSLTIPERVRFRYKLDGWDHEWHDVGEQRQAFFTHLAPRKYTFRVIACNNDGVWNTIGAVLTFSVAPAWYQTYWFYAICASAGLTILWGLYMIRLRRIAKTISARFDERLAERMRIARDLHDTFLQTIQGSKMVADDALEVSDPVRTRHALQQLSGWLDRATQESRAALHSLRLSATTKNDLAEALQRACDHTVHSGSMGVAFSVVGDSREMHPIFRDEVYRIAYEAIRNAYQHSNATKLEIELRYGQDLSVCVHDNGVGIDPSIGDGRLDHFGLQGMRERAARIRGKLTIISSAASGTRVTLTVPGAVAFSDERQGLLRSFKANLMRVFRRW
jgi:signal transduction histidine kinase